MFPKIQTLLFLADEYEVQLCNKKGYGKIISSKDKAKEQRRKRELSSIKSRQRRDDPPPPTTEAASDDSPDYHYHDAESAKWHMDKSKYDTLWKVEHNSTTTTARPQSGLIDDLRYD